MAVTRTVRQVGGSLIITIPADIANLHDITKGDELEFLPMGMGEIRLDLTRAHIPEGQHKLELECFIGSIHVTVPRIVAINATGHCTLGNISIVGEKESGFGRTVAVRSRDYAGASRKVEIEADVMLGEVKIEFGVWEE